MVRPSLNTEKDEIQGLKQGCKISYGLCRPQMHCCHARTYMQRCTRSCSHCCYMGDKTDQTAYTRTSTVPFSDHCCCYSLRFVTTTISLCPGAAAIKSLLSPLLPNASFRPREKDDRGQEEADEAEKLDPFWPQSSPLALVAPGLAMYPPCSHYLRRTVLTEGEDDFANKLLGGLRQSATNTGV